MTDKELKKFAGHAVRVQSTVIVSDLTTGYLCGVQNENYIFYLAGDNSDYAAYQWSEACHIITIEISDKILQNYPTKEEFRRACSHDSIYFPQQQFYDGIYK